MTNDDLKSILSRPGYRIESRIKPAVKSCLKREEILNKAGSEGEMPELESSAGPKSIRPKDLATPNSRRCVVRVKVFRRRLTDTGNDCWKYHLDACRYLMWLEDDNDAAIKLEEEPHEKVESNEDERVEITLEYSGFDLSDLCDYYKDGPRNQS